MGNESLRFVPAREEDAALLSRLRQRMWATTYRGIYPDDAIDAYDFAAHEARDLARLRDPAFRMFLVRDGEKNAGYFGLRDGKTFWIQSLYLLPDYRRRGFGREIFGLFTDDANVIDLSPVFIRAIVWSFPGVVLMRGANSLLQGTASAPLLMTFAFIDSGARVLFSWLFGIVLSAGFPGFVLGFGIAIYGICIPGTLYFLFGKWERKKSMAHTE